MPISSETPDNDPNDEAGFSQAEIRDESSSIDESAAYEYSAVRRSFFGRWLRRLVISSFLVIAFLAAAAYLVLTLACVEPDFYEAAVGVDASEQKRRGSEMESRLLNLRNSIIVSEEWSAEFTEDQINGWLAWDLNNKFPGLLPPEITDPRIEIGDEREMTLAFRCESKPFRGIGIIEGEVFLTGVINQVGVRFKSIRSGMIPVPLALLADQISEIAANSEIEIEWTNHEGDPVVLIEIPEAMLTHSGNYIEFKSLEIGKAKVRMAGVTHLQDY